MKKSYDMVWVERFGGILLENKTIFFDIDGTLYNDEKKIPESARQAIARLKDKGHEVVIATGRAPFVFADLREELEVDSYISLNGQYVVHRGEVIYANPFKQDKLDRLLSHADHVGHDILLVNEQGWHTNGKHSPLIEEIIGTLKASTAIEYDSDIASHLPSLQSLVFCGEAEEADYRSNFPEFEFIRWHEQSIDILPKGSSKARGIEKYLQASNRLLDHAYAFGDGLNDIEMMEYVPNSVAMGNAFAEVKAAAKHVTNHVDEDGIVNGLVKLGLID